MISCTRMLGLAALLFGAAQAFAHGGMTIGRTSGNQLVAFVESPPPFVLPVTLLPDFPGWSGFLPSFTSAEINEPEHNLYMLSGSSDIELQLVATDPGLLLWIGTRYLEEGEAIVLGPPYFDVHYIFHMPSAVPGQISSITFRLHDRAGVSSDSDLVTLLFTADYCPGDVNTDGFVDAMDFDQFIVSWLGRSDSADLNVDGIVDFADYDLFFSAFNAGC